MPILIVCAALSAVGLAAALLAAWYRRFAAATRLAGLALVPLGLALAGLVELAGAVAGALAGWAADLVLAPAVWAGFGMLAASVLLLVAARLTGRRSGGRRTRAGGAGAPASAGGGERKRVPGPGAGADEDFSEVEAILRKHGI